jgi:hypothetical protein
MAILFAALAYNIGCLLSDIRPERADQIQEGLTFVVWPLIGIVYAIWLVTSGRKGYPVC